MNFLVWPHAQLMTGSASPAGRVVAPVLDEARLPLGSCPLCVIGPAQPEGADPASVGQEQGV